MKAKIETDFVIRESSAKSPWTRGMNRRLAVMEMEAGVRPRLISENAIGCIRIIEIWENIRNKKALIAAWDEAETLVASHQKRQQRLARRRAAYAARKENPQRED